jgi:hypothetical protein
MQRHGDEKYEKKRFRIYRHSFEKKTLLIEVESINKPQTFLGSVVVGEATHYSDNEFRSNTRRALPLRGGNALHHPQLLLRARGLGLLLDRWPSPDESHSIAGRDDRIPVSRMPEHPHRQ